MTVTEFRRRFRISAARWATLADSGNLPIIRHYGSSRSSKSSEITEEDAQAWARLQPEKFQTFWLGGADD